MERGTAQQRDSNAGGASLGLGVRHRDGEVAMIGDNGYWQKKDRDTSESRNDDAQELPDEPDELDQSDDALLNGRRGEMSGGSERIGAPQGGDASGVVDFTFDLRLLSDATAKRDVQDLEWHRVFRHFNPRIERLIRPGAIDGDEVDEVLEHTWDRAYTYVRLGRIVSPRVMGSWLATVALRKLKDCQKRRTRATRREYRLDEADDPSPVPLPSAEESLLALLAAGDDDPFEQAVSIDRPTFQARWARLSEEDRELAYLYAVDGFSHAEVAAVLELPSAGASRQRWVRIKKHLGGG
jgi:DNA-directed RNA polymerase specialized sigma24 family protein